MVSNNKVSVVIPCFNRMHTISKALDSVLNQTYQNLEIIVVDDGSTDSTHEVVSKYKTVLYIRQKNSGPAAARNSGMKVSSGNFIAFLDSDDEWLPEKILTQIAKFEADSQLGIVACNVIFRSPLGDRLSNFGYCNTEFVRNLFLAGNAMVTSTVMLRRECFLTWGGFNEQLVYAEDWDFFYRIARSYKAELMAEALTIYENDPLNALTRDLQKRDRMIKDTLQVTDIIFSYEENMCKTEMKRRRYCHFFRWLASCDLYRDPIQARVYIKRAIKIMPSDYSLYPIIIKSMLINSWPHLLYRKIKRFYEQFG